MSMSDRDKRIPIARGVVEGRPCVRRRKRLGVAAWTFISAGVFLAVGTVPASALSCLSCSDCAVGGALSAHKQECEPTEIFCASVFRPRVGRWGDSSVDRGCASSLKVECTSDGTTRANTDGEGYRSPGEVRSTFLSYQCCSTDLCNASGDARVEGYRRSEEHLRNLMEGNPRKPGKVKVTSEVVGGVGQGGEEAGDGNSAQSARGAGGSRFATVLVIVGTFAPVLWLAGSIMQ